MLMERIFWISYFLPVMHGLIYLVTSTTRAATFAQQLIHTRSRVQHYMARRLKCDAPYQEMG
jgi:hypothetical protein